MSAEVARHLIRLGQAKPRGSQSNITEYDFESDDPLRDQSKLATAIEAGCMTLRYSLKGDQFPELAELPRRFDSFFTQHDPRSLTESFTVRGYLPLGPEQTEALQLMGATPTSDAGPRRGATGRMDVKHLGAVDSMAARIEADNGVLAGSDAKALRQLFELFGNEQCAGFPMIPMVSRQQHSLTAPVSTDCLGSVSPSHPTATVLIVNPATVGLPANDNSELP